MNPSLSVKLEYHLQVSRRSMICYNKCSTINSTTKFVAVNNFMNDKKTDKHDDLMHQALKIFGDVWNLSIVRVLSETTQRFNELQRSLGGVSPTTLADRLKKLETYGIIVQEKQTIDQLSVIYKLTDKGKKMLPILQAIESFSKKFL